MLLGALIGGAIVFLSAQRSFMKALEDLDDTADASDFEGWEETQSTPPWLDRVKDWWRERAARYQASKVPVAKIHRGAFKPAASQDPPVFLQEKAMPREPEFDLASHLVAARQENTQATGSALSSPVTAPLHAEETRAVQPDPIAADLGEARLQTPHAARPSIVSDFPSAAATPRPQAPTEEPSSQASPAAQNEAMSQWIQNLRNVRTTINDAPVVNAPPQPPSPR